MWANGGTEAQLPSVWVQSTIWTPLRCPHRWFSCRRGYLLRCDPWSGRIRTNLSSQWPGLESKLLLLCDLGCASLTSLRFYFLPWKWGERTSCKDLWYDVWQRYPAGLPRMLVCSLHWKAGQDETLLLPISPLQSGQIPLGIWMRKWFLKDLSQSRTLRPANWTQNGAEKHETDQ